MNSYITPVLHRYEEEKAQQKREEDAQRNHQIRRLNVARRAAHEHLEVQQGVRHDILIARLRLCLLGLHALGQTFAGVRVDVVRIGGVIGALRNDAARVRLGGGVYDRDAAVPKLEERANGHITEVVLIGTTQQFAHSSECRAR